MKEPTRLKAKEVRKSLEAGEDLLLVCAYQDEGSYLLHKLAGSISLTEFEKRRSDLLPDQRVVYY